VNITVTANMQMIIEIVREKGKWFMFEYPKQKVISGAEEDHCWRNIKYHVAKILCWDSIFSTWVNQFDQNAQPLSLKKIRKIKPRHLLPHLAIIPSSSVLFFDDNGKGWGVGGGSDVALSNLSKNWYQKSANSFAHFSVDAMRKGSSS